MRGSVDEERPMRVLAACGLALILYGAAGAQDLVVVEPMAGLWRVTWTGAINATRTLRFDATGDGFKGAYQGFGNSSVFEGNTVTARGRSLVWFVQTHEKDKPYYSV